MTQEDIIRMAREAGASMNQLLEEQLAEALANRDLADTRRNQQRVVYAKAMEDHRLAHVAWAYECQIFDKAYAEVTRIKEAIRTKGQA